MKLFLRIAVSLAVLAAIVVLVPWHELIGAARGFPPGIWLGAFAAFVAGHLLGVLKWRGLLAAGRARLAFRDAVRCYGAGLFANLCLPSIVGGDVVRGGLAARRTGRLEAVVLGSAADRVLDVATLVLLLAVGGLIARSSLPPGQAALLGGALAGGALFTLTIVAIITRTPVRRWPRQLRRPLARALVALRRLRRRPGVLALAISQSLAIQGSFVVLNAWIGRGVGIDAPLAAWFFVWPLAKLVGLLPISLGGLGVRDVTQAALLSPWGVAIAQGVVAGLVWQSVLIAGGLTGGAAWWAIGRRNGDIRGSRNSLRSPRPAAAVAAKLPVSPSEYV